MNSDYRFTARSISCVSQTSADTHRLVENSLLSLRIAGHKNREAPLRASRCRIPFPRTSMEFTHTIDGRGESSEASFDVINPATATVLARCPDASRAQLDAAVAAARRAFSGWSALSFEERRDYLHRFGRQFKEHLEEFIPLLVREQGKPLAAARAELSYTPLQMEKLCSLEIRNEVLRDNSQGRVELRYRPLGVVGIITPWNVPISIAIGRIAQALYTGNTAIQKPSPYTPLTTLKMGEITRDVLPPGVLNIIAGGDDLGPWMTAHPGIDKISFTGSVATGKKV